MKAHYLIISIILLVTAIFPMQATSSSLEVIQLKYRTAEEMIPLLTPFLGKKLDKNGVISGTGFQLIIRTTDENLVQIKKIIQKLDTAPRQLLVYVKQLSEDEYRKQHANARIHATEKKIRADVRFYSTHGRDESNSTQKIRVLEGNAAFIEMGQSIPVGERTITGNSVQETVRYKKVTSGFYVMPRISGDKVSGERVILQISPHKASLSRGGGGKINIQQAETTISGRLGEWLEIGGSTGREQHKGSGFIYGTKRQGQQKVHIMIKVEEIR